jgi:hypothetical protein
VAAFDSSSRNLKLDITVRNPQAKSIVARAATTALLAASEGVKEKVSKYAPFLTQSDWFLPLAIEPFGGLHKNIFTLVAACARRVGNVPPDSSCHLAPTFAAFWLQRISCTLMRENARLINAVIVNTLNHGGARNDDIDPAVAPVLLSPETGDARTDQGQAL